MIDPTHRYLTAVTNVKNNPQGCTTSACPLEVLLANNHLKLPVVENALQRAYEIFSRERNSKIIMESLLFCGEPLKVLIEKISKHMGTSKSVPEAYAHYFFDPNVFVDLFDNLDYIEQLSEDTSDFGIKDKITKQLAMTEGFSYVLSYFKGGSFDYTAAEYIKKLLSIANKYVAQAQNTGILSSESNQLFKWMTLGSKLALTLKTLSEDSGADALQDIRIALEYDKPPESIEVLPMEDVLRG